MTGRLRILIPIMVATLLALQGCATTADKRVNLIYGPVSKAKGGSGDLYLVQSVRPPGTQAPAVEWVLGEMRKDDGKLMAKLLSEAPPANIVLDALSQELAEAGYHVITASSVPAGAEKALALSDVSLKLDQTHATFKDEASSALKVSLQQWRGGSAVRTLNYETEYSETAVTDRDKLPAKVLQKVLELLMTRAVPELVNVLELSAPAPPQR